MFTVTVGNMDSEHDGKKEKDGPAENTQAGKLVSQMTDREFVDYVKSKRQITLADHITALKRGIEL